MVLDVIFLISIALLALFALCTILDKNIFFNLKTKWGSGIISIVQENKILPPKQKKPRKAKYKKCRYCKQSVREDRLLNHQKCRCRKRYNK